MREYIAAAASRTCGIHLDGEDGCGTGPAVEPDSSAVDAPTANATNKDVSISVICRHESHTLQKKRLVIGDVALQIKSMKQEAVAKGEAGVDVGAGVDVDTILFERKTLNDLAASIRDGRYKEQSFRMNQYCELSNHNIIYIIEGDMAKYADKAKTGANPVTKKALYSAMFSMMYLKGFSVFRTANVRETADLILYFADKYDAVPLHDRVPFYPNKPIFNVEKKENTPPDAAAADVRATASEYSGLFKYKERSAQITPDNIGEIMISAVPFVNSKTASAIMAEYKTIPNLIDAMKKDRACLNNVYIYTTNANGSDATAAPSKRKISKLCVDNLFKFLIG
jgi:ERCC4-type nuclease